MHTQASKKTIGNKNKQANVAIIGAGLAGLYSAYLLAQRNISVDVYEAKTSLGGRIMGVETQASDYLLDMGPSWIFPHQSQIQTLVAELGLTLKNQFAEGDALFQQHPSVPVRQISGVAPPDMYQIVGGTYSLIDALIKAIQKQQVGDCQINLANNSKVVNCKATDNEKVGGAGWELTIEKTSSGQKTKAISEYKQVIFAAPPRIIAPIVSSFLDKTKADGHSTFDGLEQTLRKTPTWMAAQAKFACEFVSASWRKRKLSGQAFSQAGPLVEIHDAGHDASSDEAPSVHALFGFVGLPAKQRLGLSEQQIVDACQAQMIKIFDIDKSECIQFHYQDWAKDEWVATAADQAEASQHPNIDLSKWQDQLDAINLYFACSEFSPIDAGYMEGAIVASQRAIAALVTR
ncbi:MULTISPECIES: FAD-dependent oxidoreductase [Alteromonadaceae]|uniref:FAD-dependent oxidoreductase n=1 Tax=Brumicola blandensis TaxID=3075611 RepID=A0AAW8R1R3_9ALTE|nr:MULTISPECIES: FAD-dependent oxidoreductase [unclassified Alteromonas]MDT0582141.1 FAD-dependent oxidoreductase [Alteromonas sp. W409]MDT0627903.1 FAD-dependent oxidoreductase [Alteromonas sp. W364]